MKQGQPVVVRASSQELLDHLRGHTFEENSRFTAYGREFEKLQERADADTGRSWRIERRSDWAYEKLYQLIVHRHDLRLPYSHNNVTINLTDKGDTSGAYQLENSRCVGAVWMTLGMRRFCRE